MRPPPPKNSSTRNGQGHRAGCGRSQLRQGTHSCSPVGRRAAGTRRSPARRIRFFSCRFSGPAPNAVVQVPLRPVPTRRGAGTPRSSLRPAMGRADESTSNCTTAAAAAAAAATAATTASTATAVSTSGSPHTGAGWAAERPARLLPFLHTAVVRRWATGQAMRQAVGEAVPRPGPGRQHRRLTLTHTYTLMHTHTRTGEPRFRSHENGGRSPHTSRARRRVGSLPRALMPIPFPDPCHAVSPPPRIPVPPPTHAARTCPRTHRKRRTSRLDRNRTPRYSKIVQLIK